MLCKVIFKLVELPDAYSPYIKFVAYMIPYFVIGWDILKKAFKGILNKQVFDENFLMAVATVGAIGVAIADNTKGDYTEAIAVMLFYRRAVSKLCCRQKQTKHQRPYGYSPRLCKCRARRQN